MKRKVWNIFPIFALMIAACLILQCAAAQAAVKKPGKAEIKRTVSTAPGKLAVTWKKTPRAAKYQIQSALDKKFASGKMSKTVSAKKQKCVFTELQAGENYYVRVRAYRTVSGKKYYGKWSTVRSVWINENDTAGTSENPDPDSDAGIQPDQDAAPDTDIQQTDDTGLNTGNQPHEETVSDTSTQTNADTGSDMDRGTGSAEEKKVYLLAAGYSIQINGEASYVYTGEEFRPGITVSGEGLAPLTEGTDYDASYQNNVNVGTARIIVTGKGKYQGELSTTFKITYASQDFHVKLSSDIVYVGETAKLEYAGNVGEVEFSCISRTVARIDADGTITGLKPGCTYINVSAKSDGNHKGHSETVGPLVVGNREPKSCKFYSSAKDMRTEDGGSTFVRYLQCDAAAPWLDDVEYEVKDVTPPAWAKVYADLGVPHSEPSLTVTDDRELMEKWEGQQTVTVHAGPGTRAVCVTAKKNGSVLDTVYLKTDCKKSARSGSYDFSEWDVEMYRKVRQKVESKIWTDDMTASQKLKAVEDYLNSVMHYPGTASVSKECNPSFWAEWEIDGSDTLYKGTGPDGLMMCYMGGIGDCWTGVTLLERVARDDLGLSPLYDDETDSIKNGEGYWISEGTQYSASHRTLHYQDADGKRYGYDVQGMVYSSDDPEVTCEAHGCRSRIISLKD